MTQHSQGSRIPDDVAHTVFKKLMENDYISGLLSFLVITAFIIGLVIGIIIGILL